LKKKHRGLLFSAFTLLLGIAILSTTLAAPRLRFVGQVSYEQAQTLQTAAANPPAGGTVEAAAPEAPPAQQGLQSPAFIGVKAPPPEAPTKTPADQGLLAEVWEHEKDGNNVPRSVLDRKWANDWKLNVFSSVDSKVDPSTPAVRDPSHPKIEQIIVPGSYGSYRFTIKNLEDFACRYEFSLSIGDEVTADYEEFPIRYRLFDIARAVPVRGDGLITGGKTTWTGLPLEAIDPEDALAPPLNPVASTLAANASCTYQLDWKWDFYTTDAQDITDTGLGKKVQDENPAPIPLYQVQFSVTLWADDILIILKPEGGDVTPDTVPYTNTLRYRDLPRPSRPGYNFLGWAEEPDGEIRDMDELISLRLLQDDGTVSVYAVWEADDDCEIPPWVWGIIPPILAIPVISAIALLPGIPILLGGLLLLPCLLCLHPRDKCTCDPDEKPDVVEPPKTGDSSTMAVGALAMLALSGGIALILARKRREEDEF